MVVIKLHRTLFIHLYTGKIKPLFDYWKSVHHSHSYVSGISQLLNCRYVYRLKFKDILIHLITFNLQYRTNQEIITNLPTVQSINVIRNMSQFYRILNNFIRSSELSRQVNTVVKINRKRYFTVKRTVFDCIINCFEN